MVLGFSAAGDQHPRHQQRDLLKKGKASKSLKKGKASKSPKKGKASKTPKKGFKLPKRCKGVENTPYEPEIIPPSGNIADPAFGTAVGYCATAFVASGFNIEETDNYDKWFDDDSIMYLKEAGVYQGSDNISEYVNFLFSELFEYNYVYLPASPLSTLPLVANGNECVFTFAVGISYRVKDDYSSVENPSGDTVFGYRISFDVTSSTTINVKNIHVYYPPGSIEFLFETIFDGGALARRVCNIMESSCSDTFYTKNGYSEVDECVSDLMVLPRSDSGDINGKSLGCRVLHAEFAAENDKHCPHISFLPEYDEKCILKCQESDNNAVEDIFHPFELALFSNFAEASGFGPSQFVYPSTLPPPSVP